MNPYVVSVSGVWPDEKYVYQINPSVIDYRYNQMPLKFICAPYYTEDNNLTQFIYNPLSVNELVGLSTNSSYVTPQNSIDFAVRLTPDLTFTWTPSSLRKENKGNVFGSLMLASDAPVYFGASVYPSQLFLYPLSASISNNYQILTSSNISLSVFNIFDAETVIDAVTSLSNFNFYEVIEGLSPVSSVWYSISSAYVSSFYLDLELNNFLSDNFTSAWLSSSININVGMSSVNYSLSSPYVSSGRFSNWSLLTAFYDGISYNTYQSYVLTEYASAINYNTLIYNLTSQNYFLQTSTVLLDFEEFQFADWNYGSEIKTAHNRILSQKLSLSSITNTQNINLDNIMYELSGSITYGNRPIISFYDDINPSTFNAVLEKEGYYIRPDTVRLQYLIEFYDFLSQPVPYVRGIGEIFDDLELNQDRHIESSYILKQDNISKTLTFQLLQSSFNRFLPLEDSANCVLSAILNYETSKFEYYNLGKYVYNTSNYGILTPISGVRDTDLSLRYIAETSYLPNSLESVSSTLISISSYPAVALNTPIAWSNHNRKVNWNLKYPPYYYSFKNSYKKEPNYTNYENKNSLNFYLSSIMLSSSVIDVQDFKCADVVLYNTIYSDFDIIELPLEIYGKLDYIKFELNNKFDPLLDIESLSAFLISENGVNIQFYDINTSPYVPSVSGTRLRLLYNLNSGGTIISIRPCLSTIVGPLEGYWSTTFPMGLSYNVKNYLRPVKMETLAQDLSSITLSVRHLSGENVDLDLSQFNLQWDYISADTLSIQNLTPNNNTPVLSPLQSYLFDDAHTVKITGITDQTITVSISSQKYNIKSSILSDPDYFNIYAENNIYINNFFFNRKNKIKMLGVNALVPYFSKKILLPDEASLSWTWEYDNISETSQMPISAYEDENLLIPYNYGSIKNNKQIYLLIDTEYTSTEIFKSLNIKVDVYDQGKIIKGSSNIPINSYPSPSVVSTDFIGVYDKFSNVEILDTTHNLKSLTRPPNGTNIFKFIPQKLNTTNVNISSLNWVIDTNYIFDNSTIYTPISTTIISVSTNNIGDYDSTIVKDFNVYERIFNDYVNLQYIGGDFPYNDIENESELNGLLSSLSVDILKENNSYLVYLSSNENLSPVVTSLFVASTSKYTSAFDVPNNFSFLNNLKNLYSTYYYTSTISVLSGTYVSYTYTNYVVDFWLSSSILKSSTDETIINSFSTTNILNNPNLLYFDTQFNLTTSLSYGISADIISTNFYNYNTVSLKATDVSIPGWSNLYDLQQSANVIITNKTEFTTQPRINIIPKLAWTPEKNKKANRYLQTLDIEKDFYSYFSALSGKVYSNKKNSVYEYDIRITGVQDRAILSSDKLTFIFALNGSNQIILEDQIINELGEYILPTDNKNDVIIKNLKLPYNQDLLNQEGMVLSVTAYNRFFTPEGRVLYYGMDDILSKELKLQEYPITSSTVKRTYDSDGNLVSDLLNMSPRLFNYEQCKLTFYPKLKVINLDDGGLIVVKQILETNPPNSPNIIDFDLSTVTYTLSSDYWVSSITIQALSSANINLFNLTIGDATKPLQVSNYNTSNLVISASARVATKILSTTFNKTSGYIDETDLWETVYEEIIGNTENSYKFLNFEISSVTGTPSAYQPITTGNDWVLVI